jgi:hypothetical protein
MQEYVAELVNKHAISKGYLLGTAKQAWYKFNPQKSNFDDLEEMLKVSPINLEQFFEDRPQDRPSNPLKREVRKFHYMHLTPRHIYDAHLTPVLAAR